MPNPVFSTLVLVDLVTDIPMDGEVEHSWIVVESSLRALAVVHVPVDNQDLFNTSNIKEHFLVLPKGCMRSQLHLHLCPSHLILHVVNGNNLSLVRAWHILQRC